MRFAVRAFGLAAAVAMVAAAPAPPDPLTALAAASGHAASVHLRATGTRLVEGRTVTTTVDQLGRQRLVRRCVSGEVCAGTWFDGTRAWTFGLNEVALPEEADETTLTERTLFAIDSYAFAEPAFRAAGGTVVREGADRWRVRAPDGLELTAVFDRAAQALRRVETAAGRPIAEYGREARAGGAAFAPERSGPLESGPLDSVEAMTGPLGPPRGVTAEVGGDRPVPLGTEPVPIVPCTLGGRAARCLIDSGATPSAVTLATAEALHLEPHGELEIAGMGRFATGLIEAGPLVVGAAHFERARFAVVPQSGAIHFDAIVGSDLLGRVRVVLDRGRNTARFLPGDSSAPGAPNEVRLTFRGGSPFVQALFGPQGARALLDTGDQAVLSFGYGDYRRGPQWPVLGHGQAQGIAGGDDALTVEVPTVQVGGLALGATRATVRRTQSSAHIGVGLWDRYVVDLDEAGGRLSFRPR